MKYLYFHAQYQSYNFKVLPFGLSTAPIKFTMEVKLMTQNKGTRSHQMIGWSEPHSTKPVSIAHSSNYVSGFRLDREHEKNQLKPRQNSILSFGSDLQAIQVFCCCKTKETLG